MPQFSPASLAKLATCDSRLRAIFEKVVSSADCTILEGHRDQQRQAAAVAAGASKTPWPKSKHNRLPSLALDAAPYPIDWQDRERMSLFAGFVLGVAFEQGVAVRWGGDWNGDFRVADNNFDDLVHFELMEA